MTYDPNRDPYNPNRPAYADENGSGGTALFIGALVLLALVFGGVYFYANERNPQVASDMTINNTPVTRPTTPPENPSATPSPTPSAPRSAPAPAPSSQP
jgi:hypothetical protein